MMAHLLSDRYGYSIHIGLMVALSMLAGCKVDWHHAGMQGLQGSGHVSTENRTLPDFNKVELSGAAQIVWVPAAQPGLTISADDNIIPVIQTTVQQGTLTVGSKQGYSSDHPVILTIHSPHLTDVSVSGLNQVDINGLSEVALHLAIDGAGSVKVQGQVDHLDAGLDGAGNIDALNLTTRKASVNVSGAGNVSLHVIEQLNASVSGVGEVRYVGNPAVTSQISGVGSVKKI